MQVSDKMVQAALEQFNATVNNPIMDKCLRCEGVGYHGLGSDGPDWCEECGGNQYNIRPGEEDRAMRAALEAAIAASWRPIETAPKGAEGDIWSRPVIRLWDGRRERHGYWDDDRFAKKPKPYWHYSDSIRAMDSRRAPTHWMPLFLPPAGQER